MASYIAIAQDGHIFDSQMSVFDEVNKFTEDQEIPLKEVFAWMKEHDIKLEDLRS